MKIYGPYKRKTDNRQIVVIVKDKKKTTMSYARYLLQTHLNRELESWEHVDHINNDPLDDRIENLQILSVKDNSLKYHALNPRKTYTFICPNCNKEATKWLSNVLHNKNKGRIGPYCSRKCAGQHTYKNPWK